MSEFLKSSEAQATTAEETSPQVEKKTPSKRGRMSFIERAQKESEELVKTMGGSLELEGGRRTRSSARGTPSRPVANTPPPGKKSRSSPASPKTTPRARGRGRKLETTETPEPPEQQKNQVKEEKSETSISTTASALSVKSEMNGPEKSAEEDRSNENVAKEEKKLEPETQPSENKQAPVNSKKSDQVDGMKPGDDDREQQENFPDLGEVKDEPLAKESSFDKIIPVADVQLLMDVDVQPKTQDPATAKLNDAKSISETEGVDSITSAKKLPLSVEIGSESAAVESQPTPEPMEVESSSKSSDVIECTDVVEKVEISVNPPQTHTTIFPEEHVEKLLLKVTESDSLLGAEIISKNRTLKKSKLEENGTIESINTNAAPENDIPSLSAATESTKIETPAAKQEPKIESAIGNKGEKLKDEPKLTPSKMNAVDEGATTM